MFQVTHSPPRPRPEPGEEWEESGSPREAGYKPGRPIQAPPSQLLSSPHPSPHRATLSFLSLGFLPVLPFQLVLFALVIHTPFQQLPSLLSAFFAHCCSLDVGRPIANLDFTLAFEATSELKETNGPFEQAIICILFSDNWYRC